MAVLTETDTTVNVAEMFAAATLLPSTVKLVGVPVYPAPVLVMLTPVR